MELGPGPNVGLTVVGAAELGPPGLRVGLAVGLAVVGAAELGPPAVGLAVVGCAVVAIVVGPGSCPPVPGINSLSIGTMLA